MFAIHIGFIKKNYYLPKLIFVSWNLWGFFYGMIHFFYDTLFWLLLYFQDILRLLTLWFNHGATSEVQMALQKGFLHVKIEMWLAVLPQIIARIHSNNRIVRELIQSLLVRIGKGHPQVFVGLYAGIFNDWLQSFVFNRHTQQVMVQWITDSIFISYWGPGYVGRR